MERTVVSEPYIIPLLQLPKAWTLLLQHFCGKHAGEEALKINDDLLDLQPMERSLGLVPYPVLRGPAPDGAEYHLAEV